MPTLFCYSFENTLLEQDSLYQRINQEFLNQLEEINRLPADQKQEKLLAFEKENEKALWKMLTKGVKRYKKAEDLKKLFETLVGKRNEAIAIVTNLPLPTLVRRYMKEKVGLSDETLNKMTFVTNSASLFKDTSKENLDLAEQTFRGKHIHASEIVVEYKTTIDKKYLSRQIATLRPKKASLKKLGPSSRVFDTADMQQFNEWTAPHLVCMEFDRVISNATFSTLFSNKIGNQPKHQDFIGDQHAYNQALHQWAIDNEAPLFEQMKAFEPIGGIEKCRDFFKVLLQNKHKIAIVTFNPFANLIRKYLIEKVGLTPDEVKKIVVVWHHPKNPFNTSKRSFVNDANKKASSDESLFPKHRIHLIDDLLYSDCALSALEVVESVTLPDPSGNHFDTVLKELLLDGMLTNSEATDNVLNTSFSQFLDVPATSNSSASSDTGTVLIHRIADSAETGGNTGTMIIHSDQPLYASPADPQLPITTTSESAAETFQNDFQDVDLTTGSPDGMTDEQFTRLKDAIVNHMRIYAGIFTEDARERGCKVSCAFQLSSIFSTAGGKEGQARARKFLATFDDTTNALELLNAIENFLTTEKKPRWNKGSLRTVIFEALTSAWQVHGIALDKEMDDTKAFAILAQYKATLPQQAASLTR